MVPATTNCLVPVGVTTSSTIDIRYPTVDSVLCGVCGSHAVYIRIFRDGCKKTNTLFFTRDIVLLECSEYCCISFGGHRAKMPWLNDLGMSEMLPVL